MTAVANTLSIIAGAALCAFAMTAAAADGADGARAEDAPVAVSTLKRAEVLADLAVWREAGLDAFVPGEAVADPLTDRAYQTALARYQALRSGPAFALRLQRIQRERGESVHVAGR